MTFSFGYATCPPFNFLQMLLCWLTKGSIISLFLCWPEIKKYIYNIIMEINGNWIYQHRKYCCGPFCLTLTQRQSYWSGPTVLTPCPHGPVVHHIAKIFAFLRSSAQITLSWTAASVAQQSIIPLEQTCANQLSLKTNRDRTTQNNRSSFDRGWSRMIRKQTPHFTVIAVWLSSLSRLVWLEAVEMND